MDEATFKRPHCGALYTVTVHQRLAVESASAPCKVCHRVMLQWSTASPPTLRRIMNPEGETLDGDKRVLLGTGLMVSSNRGSLCKAFLSGSVVCRVQGRLRSRH